MKLRNYTPPLIPQISGHNKAGSIALSNRKHLSKVALHLHSAFVGLVHLPGGSIDIGDLIIDLIGGDSVNFRNGHVKIDRFVVRGDEAWIEYEKYHQDVCQSYAVEEDGFTLNPNGIIRSVSIADVDIEVYNSKHQIFMLSDGHFVEWFIGFKSLRVRCAYPYWFVANTLENSILGNLDNVDIAFIHAIAIGKPKVRIGDGIKGSPFCIKPSVHRTRNVQLIGCGNQNVVPNNVEQF